jgi:hypothetical protein
LELNNFFTVLSLPLPAAIERFAAKRLPKQYSGFVRNRK